MNTELNNKIKEQYEKKKFGGSFFIFPITKKKRQK